MCVKCNVEPGKLPELFDAGDYLHVFLQAGHLVASAAALQCIGHDIHQRTNEGNLARQRTQSLVSQSKKRGRAKSQTWGGSQRVGDSRLFV